MFSVSRTIKCLLAGLLMVSASGCATLDLTKIDLRSRKATARNPAVHIVCLWEPAEGRDPKGVPCQGFAGQILFLNSKQLPVSIDGNVKIYEFDNKGTPEEQSKPLHVFEFDSTAWGRHYTYGTLGPAYNVFVPYMRRGVGDATCALRISFKPKTGPAIFSDMTTVELLGFGTGKPVNTTEPAIDPRVEETAPEDLTATDKRRKTTTIALNSKKSIADDSVQQAVGALGNNNVQQAGFAQDEDPKPLTAEDVRIAELEKMVKQLQAVASKLPPADEAPAVPPRRLEDEASRIRVRAAQSAIEPKKPTAAKPKHPIEDSDDDQTSASSELPSRVSIASRRHPLEDDSDGPAVTRKTRTARAKSHPLSNLDDSGIEATPVSGRKTSSRHPLANLDDDASEDWAPRRKPVAKQHSEDRQERSVDPFDPIDTEAIETTAVEETPSIRQKLRAAK